MHQQAYEALSQHADQAESRGLNVFAKEHAPWLMKPVSETNFVFGPGSTDEEPWTVQTPIGISRRTQLNETVLPDHFLNAWLPTVLIRHPALVFPSSYRTLVDLEGPKE